MVRIIFLIIAGVGLLALGIFYTYNRVAATVANTVNDYWSYYGLLDLIDFIFWGIINILVLISGILAFIAIKARGLKVTLIILASVIILSVFYSFIQFFMNVPLDVIFDFFTYILREIVILVSAVLLLLAALFTKKAVKW
ncbi:MAG: hypothetical protein FWD43_05415 [Coriobacteriia bacterium]|nr:hypothetical protein [Coriobacteriia bacterium]